MKKIISKKNRLLSFGRKAGSFFQKKKRDFFFNFLLEQYFLDLFSKSNSPCSNVEKKVYLIKKKHFQKKSKKKRMRGTSLNFIPISFFARISEKNRARKKVKTPLDASQRDEQNCVFR